MVVEHGQRMAAGAAEQGEVALEVHLPEFVRRRAFEALQRALSRRGSTVEQPRAAQDAGHGARRQRWAPLACEQPRKLASAPRVARLVAPAGSPPVIPDPRNNSIDYKPDRDPRTKSRPA